MQPLRSKCVAAISTENLTEYWEFRQYQAPRELPAQADHKAHSSEAGDDLKRASIEGDDTTHRDRGSGRKNAGLGAQPHPSKVYEKMQCPRNVAAIILLCISPAPN